jgi:hypothetical protein
MSEQDETNRPVEIEMVVELPIILEGPIVLEDGTTLSIGDIVAHETYGTGTIIRLFQYHGFGPGVFIDFGNDVEKQIDASFVKKVPSA